MSFARLKEVRSFDVITQKTIAEYLQVNKSTYAGWESGKDIIPLPQLYKLAINYQKSIDYLVGLSDIDKKIIWPTNKINTLDVAQNLKSFRKANHLTQQELADSIKTTQSNIHNYETGKRLITTMYALEFSKHYKYPLDQLLKPKK